MPDYAAQRLNMIKTQLAANDVADPRIQAAMGAVARERFIPPAGRALAYSDAPVPLAPGRALLDPRSFAKLLELANIAPTDHILDVGCATGYSAAVLAQLARSVVALDQDAEFLRLAGDLVPACGGHNVVVALGPLAEGVKVKAPYDAILVEGGIEEPPQKLLSQLGEGGRLVAVLQTGTQGRAHVFVRENGRIGVRTDFDAVVPPLVGFQRSVGFVF